jgi:hypothetical protein
MLGKHSTTELNLQHLVSFVFIVLLEFKLRAFTSEAGTYHLNQVPSPFYITYFSNRVPYLCSRWDDACTTMLSFLLVEMEICGSFAWLTLNCDPPSQPPK